MSIEVKTVPCVRDIAIIRQNIETRIKQANQNILEATKELADLQSNCPHTGYTRVQFKTDVSFYRCSCKHCGKEWNEQEQHPV